MEEQIEIITDNVSKNITNQIAKRSEPVEIPRIFYNMIDIYNDDINTFIEEDHDSNISQFYDGIREIR